MKANIVFFIGYTVLVFIIANRRVKKLIDILNKQEEMYDDCVSKLRLRNEQNDTLMRVIYELNKQIREANK